MFSDITVYFMLLLCYYYVIIMLLLCYYYVIIMLLLCYYYVVFMLTLITVLLSKSTELVGYYTLNNYYYYYYYYYYSKEMSGVMMHVLPFHPWAIKRVHNCNHSLIKST